MLIVLIPFDSFSNEKYTHLVSQSLTNTSPSGILPRKKSLNQGLHAASLLWKLIHGIETWERKTGIEGKSRQGSILFLPYLLFFFFFRIALLKYNTHTIKFPHLKCIINRFLVYSELCNHHF